MIRDASRETAPRRASVAEQPRAVPQQQPLLRSASSHVPTVTAAPALPVHAAREEMASLVPGKSTLAPPPQRTLSGEHRVSPPTRLTSAREVTLDEDQYDIPTFLRRQGQTEMP